jgi:Flp pilus assembly protein TadG
MSHRVPPTEARPAAGRVLGRVVGRVLGRVLARLRSFGPRDGRRGSIAVMTALMMPAVLGGAAMAIDLGVWYRETERLQLAADAGAEGAARLLAADTAGATPYQAAALIEVNGVTGGTQIGTLQTPVTVSVTATWSQVTVTLNSTADSYLARALGFTGPAISATAVAGVTTSAPAACVLALGKGNPSDAIQVDNEGSIVATDCPIFSDSTASTSMYLNSGTIEGSSIGAAGGIVKSNSGSNVMQSGSPLAATSGSSYQTSETDPLSSLSVPSAGSTCNSTTNYTAYGTYALSPTTWCGNVTIGGNGSTDTFAAGTYYVVNGSLTFNNAAVTSASGVTFVLTGSSPGSFNWTNYSNTTTMTAPTSGTLAGILVYQGCPSSGTSPANTFNGGGTLQVSGDIYAPCGALDLNNNAQLKATSADNFGVVANTIYATGSAGLSTNTSGSTSSSSSVITLLQ